ncbi:unnamed protein product [Ilex paraguariensis]|uniref:Serine carboxypeptidase-like 7 n=2 Tax=Ilex paraguariensis TaxID=185542 RepID=A0ABC8TL03_9AQUA
MALSHSKATEHTLILCTLFLVIQISQVCSYSDPSVSHSRVEFLPGFQGPLPFQLETGYVGVDESEDVQLFYYFVKSERNPKEDPLILWLNGGHGCSALSGFIYEIGPLYFEAVEYNGSLPTLVLNANSWTKVASIIFVDLPVGSGFSYGRTPLASGSTDIQSCHQAYEFLRKWLIDHPEFFSNPFYVGGESYTGITIPIITQLISNGNEAGIEPFVNLQGYMLGNAATFPYENNFQIPFAHGMGLISDELYESLKRSCEGKYFNADPSNTECIRFVEAFDQCTSGIDTYHILQPNCGPEPPRPQKWYSRRRRSLDERITELHNPKSSVSAFYCRIDGYKLSYYWCNDKNVQEALHIRKGSIGKWERCASNLSYDITLIWDSIPYHINLSTKGYRSLIYSGDHDMNVPYQSTQAWIRSLNYPIIEDWRSWLFNGQIAGYTRVYSNKMTFATVKGGGHTAPEYNPDECAAMFKRWISHEPL